MQKEIFIPPTLIGHLQNIQDALAGSHAFFYCHDSILKSKLPAFIDKWQAFGLRADAPARAYRKRTGRAAVILCISNDYLNVEVDRVSWWMFSTAGKLGLADADCDKPGKVFDARRLPRLAVGDYEFVEATKQVPRGEKSTTWTWRMTPQRFKEWEAWLAERAKQKRLDQVESGFQSIRNQPLAAGVRAQVQKLEFDINRLVRKVNNDVPILLGELPVMRKKIRKSDQSV